MDSDLSTNRNENDRYESRFVDREMLRFNVCTDLMPNKFYIDVDGYMNDSLIICFINKRIECGKRPIRCMDLAWNQNSLSHH